MEVEGNEVGFLGLKAEQGTEKEKMEEVSVSWWSRCRLISNVRR